MEIRFTHDRLEKFIHGLKKPTIAKILRTLDLLERFGHQLGMPHSKPIESNLFELRVRGDQEVRLLYSFHNSRAIILHGFTKKTHKTPQKEIALARARKKSMDAT